MNARRCQECHQGNEMKALFCHHCGAPQARLQVDRQLMEGWTLFPGEERNFSLNFENVGGGRLSLECGLNLLDERDDWAQLLSDHLALGEAEDNTLQVRVRGGRLQPGREYQAQFRVISNCASGSRREPSERTWDRWCREETDFPLTVRVKAPPRLTVNRKERHLGDVLRAAERHYPGLFKLRNAGHGTLELLAECRQSYVRLARHEFALGPGESAHLPVTLSLLDLQINETYEADLILRLRKDREKLETLTLSFVLRDGILERPVIGIDFGTSSSKVALLSGSDIVQVPIDGKDLFPSNVYVHPDGRLEIGEEATRYKGLPGYCLNLKSLLALDSPQVEIAGREVDLHEMVSEFLRRLYRKATASPIFIQWVAEGAGRDAISLVVTIPAGTPDQREQTMRSMLESIGFDKVEVLVESTAVSYLYASQDSEMVEGRGILVFDCGAGTTDVSVLRVRLERNEEHGYFYRVFDVLAEVGLEVGGNVFDAALYDFIVERLSSDQHGRLRRVLWEQESPEAAPVPEDFPVDGTGARSHRLLDELRNIKEAMSAAWRAEDRDSFEVTCPGIIDADNPIRLTRADLARQLRSSIDRLEALCHQALRQAGLHPEDVDRVYVVGGSSFLPPVERMVRRIFDDRVVCDQERVTGVSRGAVASASTRLRQVLPFDYLFVPSAGRRVVLVRRGSVYPVARTSRALVAPQQPPFALELAVLESEEGKQPVQVGTIPVRVDAAAAAGRRLVLEYEVDEFGEIDARAIYDPDGARQEFTMGVS
ncbi:MAG: Hsp70 family protein [Armatimonadetes bacterium]|nr:Hsp70 family protein [Armatimonadota bacterium]